jgi:hypothetical protein
MKRYGVAEGIREEILAELEQYGKDRAEQGKPEKAHEFARALMHIGKGAGEVMVGHTLYRVVED